MKSEDAVDGSEVSDMSMKKELLHRGGYEDDRKAVLSETGKAPVKDEAELEKEKQTGTVVV